MKVMLAGAAAAAVLLGSSADPLSYLDTGLPVVPVEIHYAPAEDLEAIDVALIDEAQTAIDIDAYVLSDWAVIRALAGAGLRGVTVRIWLDQGMEGEVAARNEDVLALAPPSQNPNLMMRMKPRGELMHLKSYCVDGRLLRTGSANFSRSGETRQDNDLVILRSPGVCAGFEAKFAKAWGGK